jgi:hypothetical protein
MPGELNNREDVEVEEVLIHLNAVLGIRIRMFCASRIRIRVHKSEVRILIRLRILPFSEIMLAK